MMTRVSHAIAFAALVDELDEARIVGLLRGEVLSIEHDSRAVRAGSVFVALRGEHVDGHDYIERARENGALAVVVDEAFAQTTGVSRGATMVVVPDTRRALSRLAAAYHGYPARSMRIAGITGTNGKTTTTLLLAAMLRAAGERVGTIGTLGARYDDTVWPLDNTTPPALDLQRLLAEMRDLGATAVVMEVSSHALALDRVADVTFAAAALTNISRDHLDFHHDLESYARAKRSLFTRCDHAILNIDDPYGERWAAELHASGTRVTTYGFDGLADVRADGVVVRADGSSFTSNGIDYTTPLPGRFNVANALAALALARALGASDVSCARALAEFAHVPGRMEHIGLGGIDVLVDYAHTPDALDVVLRAARETAKGDLIVVFGCGGDRDRGKRPQMGRIAADLADRVVVTSDNPRSEDPQAIADEIVSGIYSASALVAVELDRREAIRSAILLAKPGDVVVVAGKGHETDQIVGTHTLPFDDRDEVRAALAERNRSADA
jgi:UDP-N-acetylmuramoyl-L-alanyl-D-glutamate--2,6-diaminopimelate ligase